MNLLDFMTLAYSLLALIGLGIIAQMIIIFMRLK